MVRVKPSMRKETSPRIKETTEPLASPSIVVLAGSSSRTVKVASQPPRRVRLPAVKPDGSKRFST